MAGYWQRPDETAKVFAPDGFFKTGDIGVMDERGYVKIVDRKKDMVLVSWLQRLPERGGRCGRQLPRRDGMRRDRRAGRKIRRSGQGVHRQEGPEPHRKAGA